MVEAIPMGLIHDPKIIEQKEQKLKMLEESHLVYKTKEGYQFQLKKELDVNKEDSFMVPEFVVKNSLHKELSFRLACPVPLRKSRQGMAIFCCHGKLGKMLEPHIINGIVAGISDACISELIWSENGKFKMRKIKLSHYSFDDSEKAKVYPPPISVAYTAPFFSGQFVKGGRTKLIAKLLSKLDLQKYEFLFDHAFTDFENGKFTPYVNIQEVKNIFASA